LKYALPVRLLCGSWLALAALLGVACSPVVPSGAPDLAVAPTIEVEEELEPEAARWSYHPPGIAHARGAYRLEDGRWLVVGDLGERWLAVDHASEREGQQPDRVAQASAFRAPESLRGVIRWMNARWVFLGVSGTLYLADTPLGPLSIMSRAPTPLVSAVGTDAGLIGASRDGRAYRFDGDHWELVDTLDQRVFDVAARRDGKLLALAIPEALWASEDGGETWRALGVERFGVQRLERSVDGTVLAVGATETKVWSSDGSLQLLDGEVPDVLLRADQLELLSAPSARAEAIDDREAVIAGATYLAAVDLDDQPGDWSLSRAPLGDALAPRPMLHTGGCGSVRLAARDGHVVMVCVQLGGEDDRIETIAFRSADGGRTFTQQATLRTADTRDVGLAVAPDGVALLTGVCKPGVSECEPREPLRLPASATERIVDTRAPDLIDTPVSPAFSAEGEEAYFVGRRGKDDALALFVSEDGGKTFSAKSLWADGAEEWSVGSVETPPTLHPGPDGELGIALHDIPPRYAVADALGTITTVAKLPERTTAVSGYGRWIAAFALREVSGGPSGVAGWESSDGGVSFQSMIMPLRFELDEFDGPLNVACGQGGCVLNDRATRIGWRDDETARSALRLPAQVEPAQPLVGTPIVCALDEKKSWRTIADVEGPVLPSASVAMRADHAWSVLRYNAATGEALAVSAPLNGDTESLQEQQLLPPVSDRAAVADDLSRQMEGYAVARAHLDGTAVRRFDVAWVNYMTGTTASHAVRGLERVSRDDVTPGDRPALVTGLLSVSPRGMFVRPRQSSPDTWFVDVAGQQSDRMVYPDWPPTVDFSVNEDAVQVGNELLAVGMHVRPEHFYADTVALFKLGGGAPVARFATIAPPSEDLAISTRWSYRGDEVGIATQVAEPSGRAGIAYYTSFTKDVDFAPPVALPTQLSLRDVPQSCDATQRKTTTRFVAPWIAGTRHPVLVSSSVERFTLLTGPAVLHGTPAEPCVAAWGADHVPRRAGQMTAILAGRLEHAWLFRVTPRRARSLDVRPMSCHYAPGTPVPAIVWTQPGTARQSP